MNNLLRIDESTSLEHVRLESSDTCLYMGEYQAGGGYNASPINQLIFNLKKGVDRKGLPEWRYKLQAMGRVASNLSQCLAGERDLLIVPIPPLEIPGRPAVRRSTVEDS